MKLSIIVPVYNRQDLTSDFILSMSSYLSEETELIFVDNGSSDDTLKILGKSKNFYKHFPMKVLSLEKNYGFGVANNFGVSISSSDNILFISNDVKILGDFITPVLNEFEKNRRVAFGARLIAFPTGWNDNYYTHSGKLLDPIPYLEGFCMAVRKIDFLMVGGFDKEIFLDFEDLDLSFRLHLAGVGLKQINMPVMHIGGSTFSQLSKSRLEYTLTSQNYFMKKYGFTRRI